MKLNTPVDYFPQKILLFLKSYSISHEIKFENGYYVMTIESILFDVQCDNINECIFLSFFNWIGNKLEKIREYEN